MKAKGIVDECISELATMLADIAHTVDPHCFVLGGGVMKSKNISMINWLSSLMQKSMLV